MIRNLINVFVEKDDEKYFKCDTFWSLSKDQSDAKEHNLRDMDFIKGLEFSSISSVKFSSKDDFLKFSNFLKGSVLGYIDLYTNEVHRIYVIIDVAPDGKLIYEDYLKYSRNLNLQKIIDQNDID